MSEQQAPAPVEAVSLEIEDDIAVVTLNNPRRANVLGRAALEGLSRVAGQLAASAGQVRAVILTGSGERTFCGGADVHEMADLTPATAREFIGSLHAALDQIRRLPQPVIAAVNGACLGAGLELAVSCDMVIASERAVFGMPEIELGIPSVIEAALLLGLLGALRTKELLLTGERWEAARAERYGLVNRVIPAAELMPQARAIAARMSRFSPGAVALQKDLVNRWLATDLTTAIEYGINAFGLAFSSGDPQKAMQAFVNKGARASNPPGS